MKNVPKQDRVAPRTPEDLRRAYNFSAMSSEKAGDWSLGVCNAFKSQYPGKSLYHTSKIDGATVTVALTPLGVYVETKTNDKTEVKSKTWLEIVT
jgi:hypothetical protein